MVLQQISEYVVLLMIVLEIYDTRQIRHKIN